MEIAIIADDKKKELMTQFCIAYCGILCKHNLCATGITGKYISEATGLEDRAPAFRSARRSAADNLARGVQRDRPSDLLPRHVEGYRVR